MAEDERQDVTIPGQTAKAHAEAPPGRAFVTARPEWMIEGYVRALGDSAMRSVCVKSQSRRSFRYSKLSTGRRA
jgi:hypothetical protein